MKTNKPTTYFWSGNEAYVEAAMCALLSIDLLTLLFYGKPQDALV